MHRLIGNLVRAFFDSQLVYFKVISSWFTSLQWEKRLCNILMRILFIISISIIPKERVIVQGTRPDLPVGRPWAGTYRPKRYH